MRRFLLSAVVFALTILPFCAAFGQQPVINGQLNASGNYVPNGTCPTCVPLPVDTLSVPSAITQVQISAFGTTAVVVGTMPAVAAQTNYMCGYFVDANATAATFGGGSVVGLLGGTQTFFHNVAASPGVMNLTRTFSPCLAASAANTAIVVTSSAAGVGGNAGVTVWGYRK